MITKDKNFTTPILFIIFNKPETTSTVFEEIRKIKPKYLFIASDGKRSNSKSDEEKIKKVRNIVNKIDWPCSVKTKFRKTNAGCKRNVSEAIDWFFSHVDRGIILEDDCLPNKDFFYFLEELLERYKDNERVSTIGGSQPFKDNINIKNSYFFSKYNRIWGWGTWKRFWVNYDPDIKFWPEIKQKKEHHSWFNSKKEILYWEKIWDKCYSKKIDTWDYQMFLIKLLKNGLTIVPKKNLVSNIGFGPKATHTKLDIFNVSNFKREKLSFPLKHPKIVKQNKEKDIFLTKKYHQSTLKKIILKPKILFNYLLLIFKKIIKEFNTYSFETKSFLLLLVSISLYLIITLPAILDTNHVMRNLEPYPDGILFSLSARNLTLGKNLKLTTNWGELPFWVPPLYSYYLSIFYLIFNSVTSFYPANILLGLSTILVLYQIIKKTSKNIYSLIIGLSIYFSHLVLFWLPNLAMTENLSLFLFSLLILGLVETKLKLKLILIVLASMSLSIIRFSILPIILTTLVITLFQLKKQFDIHQKKILFLITLSILIGTYFYQSETIKIMKSTIFSAILNKDFFNINFIYPNLIKYLKALFFHQGQFLWLQIGVSSWPILGIFFYSIYHLYKSKKLNKFYILVLLLISLFPLQLIFYTVDSRYLIYAIVLFSLAGAWLVNEIKSKKIIFMILIAILLNIFFQRNLLKQLIADNWLGKSTAWQYEAILHFNKTLPENSELITALPPFLVDAYQDKNYRTLPLSQSQEFMQKKQFVWGEDVNYTNLVEGYKNWLEQGRELYITNSYITHQQPVIADFENFKKEFELELVQEGCLQACNIYKLKLLETDKSPQPN